MRNFEELTADEARRLVPISRVTIRGKSDEPARPATVRLYVKEGYRPRGYDGPPVFLRAVLIGQTYWTLPEWADEFELARARLGRVAREAVERAVPRVPDSRRLQARLRRAEQALDKMGV